MIPKIIWQTHEWKYEDLPENFRGTLKTWKNLNPEWDHRYVDAEQRAEDVKKYDQNLYRYYILTDKVTQADIWRYIITYTNGGVYADMDSVCFRPINCVIKNFYNAKDMIVTPAFDIMSHKNKITIDKKLNYEKNKINWQEYEEKTLLFFTPIVNNANFATIKNSKIMKIIIDNILDKYSKIKLVDVFEKFPQNGLAIGHLKLGPKVYSDILRLHPNEYSDVVMENKEIISFNFDVAIHGKEYKENFNKDFFIGCYGKKQTYKSFVKENNLEFY